jgi:hypothetical protein
MPNNNPLLILFLVDLKKWTSPNSVLSFLHTPDSTGVIPAVKKITQFLEKGTNRYNPVHLAYTPKIVYRKYETNIHRN